MKQRYGLLKRPWGVFYAKDKLTGNSESLGTRNKQEAQRLLHAKNEALMQPMLNRQIARAYLSATDPAAATRDWQFVMDEVLKTVRGPTKDRWLTAIKDKAYAPPEDSPPGRNPRRALPKSSARGHGGNQRLPAPPPQFCLGHELAACSMA